MELPRSYRECEPRYSWRTTQHEATSAATKAQPSDSDPGALLDHELGPRFPPPPPHPMVPPAAYAPFHHTHHYPHDRLPPPMYAVPMAVPWGMPPPRGEAPAPPRAPPPEPPTFPRREALSRACAAEPFFPAHMDSRQQRELVHPRWTMSDAALGHGLGRGRGTEIARRPTTCCVVFGGIWGPPGIALFLRLRGDTLLRGNS